MSQISTRNYYATQGAHATSLRRFPDTRRLCSATGLHDGQKNTEVSR